MQTCAGAPKKTPGFVDTINVCMQYCTQYD